MIDEFDLPADEVARIEGERAYWAGKQRSDSPYTWRDKSELCRQWLFGYNKAKDTDTAVGD